jgi:AraC-like DNA-binding protein
MSASDQTPASSPAASVISGTIQRHSIEDVAPPLRQYFDLDIHQLQRGGFRSRMEFLAAGKTAVYRENYPVGTTIAGELLGGRFGVAIPLVGSARFSGKTTSRQVIASAITGEQIDFLASGGHAHMVLVVDHARLIETAVACRVSPRSVKALSAGRHGMPVMASPFAVDCIVDTFGKMIDRGVAGRFSARRDNFEDLVIDALLSLVECIEEPLGRPPAAVLFRRAMERAESQPHPPCQSRLAADLRVSPSTLQKAFISATGLPPCQYFIRRRLNQARAALLAADPRESFVTNIAFEHGFTEHGRFSVRYRELFGESPSDTLRRAPRKMFVIPG